MIHLYGNPRSGSTQPVLWYLDEIGLSYELVLTGRGYAPASSPEYLRLNPNAMVPTLRDGDHVLWESTAILRYLAATHGERRMYPAEPLQSLCDQWMTWYVSRLHGICRRWYIEVFRHQSRDPAAVQIRSGQAEQLWQILDNQLAGRSYMLGDTRSLADLCMIVSIHRWQSLAAQRTPRPHIDAWYARMRSDDRFGRWIDLPFR